MWPPFCRVFYGASNFLICMMNGRVTDEEDLEEDRHGLGQVLPGHLPGRTEKKLLLLHQPVR